MTVRWWMVAVAALMMLITTAPAHAQESGNKYLNQTKLGVGLDLLAEQIADIMAKQKAIELNISEVVCPASKDDPHASGLESALRWRLERKKLVLKDGAVYDLRIEYGFEQGDSGLEMYIQASLRKLGKEDRPLPKLERIPSNDIRDMCQYTGVCLSLPLPTEASGAERNEALRKGREQPRVHVSGDFKTRVSASPESRYFVELVAGSKDGKGPLRERGVTVEGGVALAQIDRDEEYRVRIANSSASEVACRLFIDGIDLFHFTEDRLNSGDPMYKHIIVPPGKVIEVPGWHKTATKARADNWQAFVVTEFGKGAASRVNPKGPVGMVQVLFAQCYDPNDKGIKGRSASMETGRGRDINGPQEPVQRKIDPPHESVVIRYTRGVEPGK